LTEWRSGLQTGWGLGGRPLAAARATAAKQAYLGHIRPDRRQLDALVNLLRSVRRVGEHGIAHRAGGQPPVNDTIGVRM
jgi:hypothetical protein